MIIAVSGPEKAGKSTLCRAMQEYARAEELFACTVQFSGRSPFTAVDMVQLLTMDDDRCLFILDRTWACAAVYQRLFEQGHITFEQEAEAIGGADYGAAVEKDFGNYVEANGVRLMLLGPGASQLQQLRTPDDFQLPAKTERDAYRDYGEEYGWLIATNSHGSEAGRVFAEHIVRTAMGKRGPQQLLGLTAQGA